MTNKITSYLFAAAFMAQLAGCGGGGGGGGGDTATTISAPVTSDPVSDPVISTPPSVDTGLIWNASNWDQRNWE